MQKNNKAQLDKSLFCILKPSHKTADSSNNIFNKTSFTSLF